MCSSTSDLSVSQSSQNSVNLNSLAKDKKSDGKNCMRKILAFLPVPEEQRLSLVSKDFKELLDFKDFVFDRIVRKIDRQDALTLNRGEKESLKSGFLRDFKQMSSETTLEELKNQKEACKSLLLDKKQTWDAEVRFFDEFLMLEVQFHFARQHMTDQEIAQEETRRIDRAMQNNPDWSKNKAFFISAVKSGNSEALSRVRLDGTTEEKLEIFASAIHVLGLQNRLTTVVEITEIARTIFRENLEETLNGGQNRQFLKNLLHLEYQDIFNSFLEYFDNGGRNPSQEEIADIQNPRGNFQMVRELGERSLDRAYDTIRHPFFTLETFFWNSINIPRRIITRHPNVALGVAALVAVQVYDRVMNMDY